MQLVYLTSYRLALLLILLASSVSESLAESKAKSSSRQAIQLGVQDFLFYAPYSRWQNDQYQGFNRELFDLFAAYLQQPLHYQPYSVKRRTLTLISGESVLIYPDNPNWARETKGNALIHYSAPVVQFIDGVMVKQHNSEMTLTQLKRLGVPLGFTPVPFEKQIDAGTIKVHQEADLGVLINMVLEGALDGVYLNTAVGQYFLEEKLQQPQALIAAKQLPAVQGTRHLSSVHNPEIISKFDQFLKQRSERIHALKRKYGLFENN